MGWHREPLIGFDLETAGTDPRATRMVTGAVTVAGDAEPTGRRERLAERTADAIAGVPAACPTAGAPVTAVRRVPVRAGAGAAR
ncbi:hypothetical protein ACPF8X_04965 [Streptomyces sp. G35A]